MSPAKPASKQPAAAAAPAKATWLRRLSLDALRDLNELQANELGRPETRTRIASYELAFRMQAAAPEVKDIHR